MCDNKNELHQSEYDKSKDYTSTRLDLDITETTDSYPEFDFLDLLRNLQVKDKKVKHKSSSEISSNKSNAFSDEDSEVEDLAKFYEEKYGTCNDYAELGEGYDEEDSFIDNSDAVNDLVPSGIQTEFGGFYINRGKLNFVKEDNSSSSTSEDADKFLQQNRLNSRRIISDDESEEKETSKNQSNILQSSTNNSIIHSNSNNTNNIISSSININSGNNNSANNNNSHTSNNSNIHSSSIIKNKKRSKEYQHKSKKIRKTATPKIPDHLLYKKPFPGSLEYRKNINEFKKNRLKTVESDKKINVSSSVGNSANINDSDNINSHNNVNAVNSSSSFNNNNNNNNNSNSNNNNNNNKSNNGEDDVDTDKKEGGFSKKKALTVKELLKEREGAYEESSKVLGQRDTSEKRQSSSSSESCESSSSDSDSYSSEDTPPEKEKIPPAKPVEEISPKGTTLNGSISKEITAKSFAHLSDSLKELIAKVLEISKEEKNKSFNSKLNSLLLSMDEKLRELPMAERNAVLEHVAEILQMKKDNITKRIKKLLVLQEEAKMSVPLRKLKEAVANILPLLQSNYFNEFTKAAGTSPQIYAELSRYYWSIDPGSLPQRKFPWNEEMRRYLREIVQYRKNCYYIIRPRKESLVEYIRSFMEAKVKHFWPKEWMTVDILLEESEVTTQRQTNDKQKTVTKILGTQNSSNVGQKKTSPNTPVPSRKQGMSIPASSASTPGQTSRKPGQTGVKNPEVKSILIPRKTPQSTSSGTPPQKSNFASSLANLHNINQGSRLQVTLNRLNVQEYLDRVSGSQTSISRNSHQQISPNRSRQSVSPSRLVKTSPPNSVLATSGFRSTPPQKSASPNSSNKSISSSVRNCNNQQSVLKTAGGHGNPVKTSPNSVTISPVNESVFKDVSPSPEVLNLTKNASVYISKVKDGGEARTGRSSSPSIGIPLPSGITISPTSASTPSTFLSKPQKQVEKISDVKINVSITKQESGVNLAKDKRETVMNLNVKREGPLQNIPDCISVTSKVVPNERPKFEHVRKRALHEYHQQQHSPEKLKFEEKKLRTEENLLTDIEMKEDKLDDKNFSKIFDSVIEKTSETVRQSESASSQVKVERFSGVGLDSVPGTSGSGAMAKNSLMGVSQFKNYPAKIRDVRPSKEKTFYSGGGSLNEKNYSEAEDRSKTTKEQRVQMEMDRVMQNLVELSREKNPDYEMSYSSPTSTGSSGLKPATFQEPYQKILFK